MCQLFQNQSVQIIVIKSDSIQDSIKLKKKGQNYIVIFLFYFLMKPILTCLLTRAGFNISVRRHSRQLVIQDYTESR